MIRKVGLGILYFIAILYLLMILLPTVYCLRHGCRGPGEGDAFMPAFMLIPIGSIATTFCLRNAILHIRARHSLSWLYWPLAIIFGIFLAGSVGFILLLIFMLKFHH